MRGSVSIKDAVFESDLILHAAIGVPGEGPHVDRLGDVVMVPAPTGHVREAGNVGALVGAKQPVYHSGHLSAGEIAVREAMVVLARTVCLPSAGNSALARFPDRNQVGAWAADSVSAMVERGYVSGYNDGRLNPKGQITRAEMAQIMSNIFQSVHDSGDLTGTYQDTASTSVRVVFTAAESPTYKYAGRSKAIVGLSALPVNRTLLPLSMPPIGDIAFSLPEYGYTDRTEEVKLLTKNDLTGSVVWTLTKDGVNQPLRSTYRPASMK